MYWLARARLDFAARASGGARAAAKGEAAALLRVFGRLLGEKPVPPGAERWKEELGGLGGAVPPKQPPEKEKP